MHWLTPCRNHVLHVCLLCLYVILIFCRLWRDVAKLKKDAVPLRKNYSSMTGIPTIFSSTAWWKEHNVEMRPPFHREYGCAPYREARNFVMKPGKKKEHKFFALQCDQGYLVWFWAGPHPILGVEAWENIHVENEQAPARARNEIAAITRHILTSIPENCS